MTNGQMWTLISVIFLAAGGIMWQIKQGQPNTQGSYTPPNAYSWFPVVIIGLIALIGIVIYANQLPGKAP